MRTLLCLLLAALVLTGCAARPRSGAETPTVAPSASAAEPTPDAAPQPTAEPAPAPSPAPAAAMPPEVPLETWAAAMPRQPEYTIATAEAAIDRRDARIAWPEGLTLYMASWTGTLEEAAAAYGIPLETLTALNPDAQRQDLGNGMSAYTDLKLSDGPCELPREPVKLVTVSTPWVEFRAEQSNTYEVPAALDDQAAACLATAYDFIQEHARMHVGIDPSELLADGPWYASTDGALFTRYTDLEQYLLTIFTPESCDAYLGGPLPADTESYSYSGGYYYRGEGDRICFVTGDSGSFIGYCGAVYTRPELQPDGSLLFWQIELTIESEDFAGWAEDKTYTPDTARAVPVRLVPTDAGWRVAEVSALG